MKNILYILLCSVSCLMGRGNCHIIYYNMIQYKQHPPTTSTTVLFSHHSRGLNICCCNPVFVLFSSTEMCMKLHFMGGIKHLLRFLKVWKFDSNCKRLKGCIHPYIHPFSLLFFQFWIEWRRRLLQIKRQGTASRSHG